MTIAQIETFLKQATFPIHHLTMEVGEKAFEILKMDLCLSLSFDYSSHERLIFSLNTTKITILNNDKV